MKIPRYWAKADASMNGLALRAWGWSDRDLEEAQDNARARLRRMSDRVAKGDRLPERYPYGAGAMREEILEEHGPSAVVTRNSYGSEVLNTTRLLFIDVDDPPSGGFLRSLFGARGKDAGVRAVAEALQRVSKESFRIYRTAAGLRVLGTERAYEPGSAETEALMKAVNADPQFVQLCRAQHSFRARLTPKPWRCGARPAPNYPRDAVDEDFYREWVADYAAACASKATCRFVEQVGAGRVSFELTPLVRLHDAKTKAAEPLDLA